MQERTRTGGSHLQHRLELCPAEAGPLRGCKGRATHVCWAVVASQGRRGRGTNVPAWLWVLSCTVLPGVAVCSPCSQAHCRQRLGRVLTFTSSGRNWDLARERGLSIPCTCIQLPAGMGTEQGPAVGAGVRAALAAHRGCCCYYFHGRGNMIY